MAGIDLHKDGPHSDAYTIELAVAFAETVRVLNYATGSHAKQGLGYPQTVYQVAGMLTGGAGGLGQLFGQLATFLYREYDAGRLAHDTGADVLAATLDARRHLTNATRAANELFDALAALAETTSHLYVPDTPAHGSGEEPGGGGRR